MSDEDASKSDEQPDAQTSDKASEARSDSVCSLPPKRTVVKTNLLAPNSDQESEGKDANKK